ncbi:MAG: MBL fold metallo-hydrolase [Candidatus Margulisbacteria bacterium]|jgi:glyoxylase-like metal-dependent hydrolase (beta-lactamase superfamily II)|nr:MBL fold metallo-hydrolase [Candidatus Margulisiibacteriota bacterium]
MLNVERIIVGPLHTNCYLATYAGQTVIIDPGAEAEKISARLAELGLNAVAIVNTHGHWDHLMANSALRARYAIPVFSPLADRELIEQEKEHYHIDALCLDKWYDTELALAVPFQVIQTPGHTPGSTCLLLDGHLFSGDTLFAGGYLGRTDLWGGDAGAMQRSLARLLELPDETLVWPGHEESSTIGQERGFYAFR